MIVPATLYTNEATTATHGAGDNIKKDGDNNGTQTNQDKDTGGGNSRNSGKIDQQGQRRHRRRQANAFNIAEDIQRNDTTTKREKQNLANTVAFVVEGGD